MCGKCPTCMHPFSPPWYPADAMFMTVAASVECGVSFEKGTIPVAV